MISEFYKWSETFQLRLLTYYLRDPEKLYDVIEPQWFSSPIHKEISRILKDVYTAHGKDIRVSRSTLTELVRATMGEQDSWSLYKKTIKELYELKLMDRSILYRQAFEFAKETKYREALIAAEKDITNRRYQKVHERIENLLTPLNGTSVLGHKDFQTPHRLQTAKDNTWLIEPLIPDNGLTLFVGPPESDKSLVSLLWEYCVTRRRNFLGLQTRWATVLHIDCENGTSEIKRRCELFGIRLAPGLLFWCLDDPKLGPPPQLPSPIYEQFAKKGWVLVFDSLAFQTSGKVIKAEDIVPILFEFKRLAAKTGVPIIAIHHSSDKDDRNTYLGSTFIRASLDAGYFVETTKDPTDDDRHLVELFSIKGRRGGGPTLAMRLDFEEGEYWKVESPHEEEKREPMQLLVEVIRKHPHASKEIVLAKSHLPRHKARKLLQLGEGKYWRAVATGTKNHLRYELIEEDDDEKDS
jgi:hypothetical protein